MLIHINSWPGAGKKTIGQILAKAIGARFFHNHLLLDLVESCCERDDPGWQPLYDDVRSRAYETLAGKARGESLVLTNAMASGEMPLWSKISDLAARRGDDLVPVVLHISPPENRRRLEDPARIGAKLKSAAVLESLRASHALLVPVHPHLFEMDISDMSASDAALRISQHLDGLSRRAV